MIMTTRRICYIVSGIISLLFVTFMIILILALTAFKPKHPVLQTVSSTVEAVSTDISPPLDVQLNFTLTLQLMISNPNLADFEFNTVENLVYYRNGLVGKLTLPSSTLPAKGSTLLSCPLVLQIDKFVANISDILQDILQKKIEIETKSNMPGKITVLGIFKAHLNTFSHCKLVLSFPSMKVETQVCELKTKL
ncbi:unnamed protein product [Eruca vesicaria subsp. sativa]|uniref:Late embryogenesis abundant protein LEA-2 subgroup domain-containing protein n=1 Tax=Eruca vesicaria subsp. sativa TaxID=29727 RepID=A0ABC8KQQ7_ERUVS|nr:unnamed protein product [Eruca vesicaria subsp. sativa]